VERSVLAVGQTQHFDVFFLEKETHKHLIVYCPSRTPTCEQLSEIKTIGFGENENAVLLFPSKGKTDKNDNQIHLWKIDYRKFFNLCK
jgi:hypothetical protein